MHLFGITDTFNCAFCQIPHESHSHLFFDCIFTNRIWHVIKSKCNVQWPDNPWADIVPFVSQASKGKSLKSIILRLSFSCTI
ncbi:hypothetical protein ACSBR1_020438 [Camellia fascicularis]